MNIVKQTGTDQRYHLSNQEKNQTMTTLETILNLVDALFGLVVLVNLLLPGRNMIKDIAIPMLAIITIINLLGEYTETRNSVITIVGWIFGTDLAPR